MQEENAFFKNYEFLYMDFKILYMDVQEGYLMEKYLNFVKIPK